MKKLLILTTFVLNLAQAQGIPVVDAAALAQQQAQLAETVKNWAEEANRWKSTAEHYQVQIQSYKDQLASVTGVKNVGGLLDSTVESTLSKLSFPSLSELVSTGKDALSPDLKSRFEALGVFDRCKNSMKTVCEARVINTIKSIDYNEKYAQNVQKEMLEIDQIVSRMRDAKDIKESNDLANMLQSKRAVLDAYKMQLEMQQISQANAEKILDEQHEKAWAESQKKAPIPKFKKYNQ